MDANDYALWAIAAVMSCLLGVCVYALCTIAGPTSLLIIVTCTSGAFCGYAGWFLGRLGPLL